MAEPDAENGRDQRQFLVGARKVNVTNMAASSSSRATLTTIGLSDFNDLTNLLSLTANSNREL